MRPSHLLKQFSHSRPRNCQPAECGQVAAAVRNICVEQSDLNQRAAELIEEAAQIRAETKIKIRDMQTELKRRNVSLDELNRVVRRRLRP